MINKQLLKFNNILFKILTYENKALNEEIEPEDSILKEIYNDQTFIMFKGVFLVIFIRKILEKRIKYKKN